MCTCTHSQVKCCACEYSWKTRINSLNYSIFHSILFTIFKAHKNVYTTTSDPKYYDIININIWECFVCLFVCFRFRFCNEVKISLFRFFIHVYLLHTFCFLLFIIEKGEHLTWTKTHTSTCNVFPNGSIPSLYSIVDIVLNYDRISSFYVATLTSYAFEQIRCSCEYWIVTYWEGERKRNDNRKVETPNKLNLYFLRIQIHSTSTYIMWLQNAEFMWIWILSLGDWSILNSFHEYEW